MSKAALSKAIKKGRISATRKENGSLDIDPAELHRVYPPVNTEPLPSEQKRTQETLNETTRLQAKVAALGELLEQVKAERDDLRQDRDQWREQARLALLTHQSQSVTAPNLATDLALEPKPQQEVPTKRDKLWEALKILLVSGGGLAVVYILRRYGLI